MCDDYSPECNCLVDYCDLRVEETSGSRKKH